MFRAVRCSSSGSLIVSMQHLISSVSVADCPVHRLRTNWSDEREFRTSDQFFLRCCIDTIRPPKDEQRTTLNM
jgi:hypothetical protein